MKRLVDRVTKKEFLVSKRNIKSISKNDNIALITLLTEDKLEVEVKDTTDYYLLIHDLIN